MKPNFNKPKSRIMIPFVLCTLIGIGVIWHLIRPTSLVTPAPRPPLTQNDELTRMNLVLSVQSVAKNRGISTLLTRTVAAADTTGLWYILSDRLALNTSFGWKQPSLGQIAPVETLDGPKITQTITMMDRPYSPASTGTLRCGEYLLTFNSHVDGVVYNLPLDGLHDPNLLLYRQFLAWLAMPNFSEFLRQTKAVAIDPHQTALARFVAVKCIRIRVFESWERVIDASITKTSSTELHQYEAEYDHEQNAIDRILTEVKTSPGLPDAAYAPLSAMYNENDEDMADMFSGTNDLI